MVCSKGFEGLSNLLWFGNQSVLFPVPFDVLDAKAGPFSVARSGYSHHRLGPVVVGVAGWSRPLRGQAHPVWGPDPGDDAQEGVDGVADVHADATDAASLPRILSKGNVG